jgi:hypothetical protein
MGVVLKSSTGRDDSTSLLAAVTSAGVMENGGPEGALEVEGAVGIVTDNGGLGTGGTVGTMADDGVGDLD